MATEVTEVNTSDAEAIEVETEAPLWQQDFYGIPAWAVWVLFVIGGILAGTIVALVS